MQIDEKLMTANARTAIDLLLRAGRVGPRDGKSGLF